MATLNSALDVAKTALFAAQKAITVTAHNISNASTEGYTRQRAVLEASEPLIYGGLMFGTGVNVASVQRVYDSFTTAQYREASSSLSRFEANEGLLKRLEAVFNDINGSGALTYIDKFFNGFQNVANNAPSYTERAQLLSTASSLADTFNNIASELEKNLSGLNDDIVTVAGQINTLAGQAADLNLRIAGFESSGAAANDLRDKRDSILDKLSEYVSINIVESDTGAVDVSIAGGSMIVAGVKSSAIKVLKNNDDQFLYDVVSNGSVINSKITGGRLKGLAETADYYRGTMDRVDRLAAHLIKEVNMQHGSGYGLDGSTGVEFFSAPTVRALPSASNTGGTAVASAAIDDYSLLTFDDYEIRFLDTASYIVVDSKTKAVVSSGAYSSGSAITFDGMSVTIEDTPDPPASGDVYGVSAAKDAAKNFSVALTDARKIAASGSLAGLPGDNTNALLLTELKAKAAVDGATFSEYYRSSLSDAAIAASDAGTRHDAQKKITEELKNLKESASGVSLEEEAVNLIKLQKAFEAAARVISTVNEMYDTLLNIR